MSEYEMNSVFNKYRFNSSKKVGCLMKEIRKLSPTSLDQWKNYYLTKIKSDNEIHLLANEMAGVPELQTKSSPADCYAYITDAVFRRTFDGFSRERQILALLRQMISPNIWESDDDWDRQYYIDFYSIDPDGLFIGIQVKPLSFYSGNYKAESGIDRIHTTFRNKYYAKTFTIIYAGQGKSMRIANPSVIVEIKNAARF